MTKTKKKSKEYDQAVANYKSWTKFTKDLEKHGYHGADYYINRVAELEEEVKKLKARLKLDARHRH